MTARWPNCKNRWTSDLVPYEQHFQRTPSHSVAHDKRRKDYNTKAGDRGFAKYVSVVRVNVTRLNRHILPDVVDEETPLLGARSIVISQTNMAFRSKFSGYLWPAMRGDVRGAGTYDMATGSEGAGNDRGIGKASNAHRNIKTVAYEIDATIVEIQLNVD